MDFAQLFLLVVSLGGTLYYLYNMYRQRKNNSFTK